MRGSKVRGEPGGGKGGVGGEEKNRERDWRSLKCWDGGVLASLFMGSLLHSLGSLHLCHRIDFDV